MDTLLRGILPLVIVSSCIFVVLIIGELIRLKQRRVTEFQRKFIHILVGSFIATWPWYLDWWQIQLMSVAFVVIVLFSQHLKIFRSIFGIQRHTWGEVLFGSVVGILTLLTNDPMVFAVAMLHMSVADGFAALFGIKFGRHTQYRVFGNVKSVVGTVSFFAISVGILTLYSTLGTPLSIAHLLELSLLVTLLENVGVRGFDNILVPVAIALVL